MLWHLIRKAQGHDLPLRRGPISWLRGGELLDQERFKPDWSMPYGNEYTKTEHWDRVRKRARVLGSGRCELCGAHGKGTTLQVHHRNYYCLWRERWRDVALLCRRCHTQYHSEHVSGWHPAKKQVQKKRHLFFWFMMGVAFTGILLVAYARSPLQNLGGMFLLAGLAYAAWEGMRK